MIRFGVRKVAAAAGVLLLVVGVTVGSRHQVAAWAVARSFEKQTGYAMRMRGVHLHLFSPQIDIAEMEILNPSGFQARRAMLIRDIRCRWVTSELMRGRLHATSLRLNLAEVHAIRSKDGKMNPDSIHSFIKAELDSGKLSIDTLLLSVGEGHYTNEGRPDRKPMVYDANLKDCSFQNIRTSKDFSDMQTSIITATFLDNVGEVLGTTMEKMIQIITVRE